MRAIHTGAITWGLVNVPVKLYSAVESHTPEAHQVHAADGGKVRYVKTCSTCSETLSAADISRSFEGDNGPVVLSDDDLSALPEVGKEIEVLEFVSAGAIDPMAYDRPYYVQADGAAKAYALLTRVLRDSGRVAIVRFGMRGSTHLAALRVAGKGNALAIHTLRWADEIREPDFPALAEVNEPELKMAEQLVESMVADWNPERYRDERTEELRELIAAKGVEQSDEVPDDVADLVAKLAQSTAARKPRVRKVADKPVRRRARVAS